MFGSLRNRLTVIFIALAILPLIIVSAILTTGTFATLEQEALDSQETVAERVGTEIRSIVERRENELTILTQARGIGTLDLEEQELLLNSLLSYETAYLELALIDGNGRETVRVSRIDVISEDDLRNRMSYPEFTVPAANRRIYYSPVRFDENLREPMFTLAVPITDIRTGGIQSVLTANVRFKPIWDLIAATDLRGDGIVYMVDDSGSIVAHANPSVVLRGTQITLPDHAGRTTGLTGDEVLRASTPIKFGNQQFYVVAERPLDEALTQARDGLYLSAGVTAFALAFAIGLVVLVVSQIVRPIERLSAVARNIQGGDLTQRAFVTGKDEIGALANSFNEMTQKLADSIDHLEDRVDARTRDLKVAAAVSRQVTTVLDLEALLPQLVASTRAGFNLYHVSVFLYDDERHVLEMEAGIGRYGSVYQSKEKTFALDAAGIVPVAARQREPVLANDVGQSTDFTLDTALPLTRSQLAIPMVIGTTLVGVLDLQSDEVNHFQEEDTWVLTSLAEQLAVAVQNARLYAEQVETAESLREMDRMKSQFLASMSHELRTPLNAILNFTQFVVSGVLGEVNERQMDALNKTIASGEHLLGLINDVLDITKIEAGKLELFVEEVDLDQELQSVIDTANSLLQNKPTIRLVTDIQTGLPHIMGDKRRIRQIFLNLVSNAVKFTQQGSITISAHPCPDYIEFAVKDTGPGIAIDDRDLIFESFRQDKSGLRNGEGTGLGLPISRQLAEAHDGKLWLESEIGVGTTFFVRLPVHSEKVAAMMEV